MENMYKPKGVMGMANIPNMQAVMGAQYAPMPAGMGAQYAPMSAVSPAFMGPTQMGPTQVAPTQVMPTVMHPTQNFVNTNVMKHIVPHVHPSHTTNVNQHIYEHQHHFPHTQSVVNKCCSQNVLCGTPSMVSPAYHPHHHPGFCPPRPPHCC
ncbi:CotD family spore coat protein [Peribacillus tepidiphilus]|uniref:CotD family spore coat protein n=1 Tax=Peribacillus tepidiphilus TaxID=2652445 RepID=UPI0035B529C4